MKKSSMAITFAYTTFEIYRYNYPNTLNKDIKSASKLGMASYSNKEYEFVLVE